MIFVEFTNAPSLIESPEAPPILRRLVVVFAKDVQELFGRAVLLLKTDINMDRFSVPFSTEMQVAVVAVPLMSCILLACPCSRPNVPGRTCNHPRDLSIAGRYVQRHTAFKHVQEHRSAERRQEKLVQLVVDYLRTTHHIMIRRQLRKATQSNISGF